MSFTPQEIRAMSMWQFMAALDGFIAANSPEDTGLTAKEAEELWEWLEAG